MRLDAFVGTWSIDRSIEDIAAGRNGTFAGHGTYRREGSILVYEEAGTISFPDYPAMAAQRSYRWRDGGDGSIVVDFADGRFFHRFYADETRPNAAHHCPPDRYQVSYDFSRWPRWNAEWRVLGPRKNYLTVSTFRPAGQSTTIGA